MEELGCQFIVERPDFPRACVVNSVYYSAVYPKRGQERLQFWGRRGATVLSEKSLPERRSTRPRASDFYWTPSFILGSNRHPLGRWMRFCSFLFSSPSLSPSPTSCQSRPAFPLSPAYNREPSLTLNLCFCITGLVCFFFFLSVCWALFCLSLCFLLQWK